MNDFLSSNTEYNTAFFTVRIRKPLQKNFFIPCPSDLPFPSFLYFKNFKIMRTNDTGGPRYLLWTIITTIFCNISQYCLSKFSTEEMLFEREYYFSRAQFCCPAITLARKLLYHSATFKSSTFHVIFVKNIYWGVKIERKSSSSLSTKITLAFLVSKWKNFKK